MYRGQNTPRGRGTPRGGSRGNTPRGSGTNTPRGRGRGRGGGARWEVEQEAQAVMADLGIPYNSPYRGRGGGGQQRGFSPFRGAFTPPGGRGRGKRGGGLGYRQAPEDDRGYEWARPIGGGGRGAGFVSRERERDPRDRPLLKPVLFVRAGTLFEDRDDLLKAEVQDADEDQEATAEWLAKAFERAAEIERAAGHNDSALPSGVQSGVQTPRDALEELVAQAVTPGVFLQATATTTATVTSTVKVEQPGEGMEIDSEEEDEVVYVAPAQRSQVVSKAPTPEPPAPARPTSFQMAVDAPAPSMNTVPAPEPPSAPRMTSFDMAVDAPAPVIHEGPAPAAEPPSAPRTTSFEMALSSPFSPPPSFPTPIAAISVPALEALAAAHPHSVIQSVDASRAGTPERFPSAGALEGLLRRFGPVLEEGTTSAASTPAEMVEGREHTMAMEEVVRALQGEAAVPPATTAEAAPAALRAEELVPPALPTPAEAPTFESFAFSPTFSPRKPTPKAKPKSLKRKEISRLRRTARKQRAKLSMPGGEEPRVGDSDLEWGTDGPPVRVPGEEEEESDSSEEDGAFTAAADKLALGGQGELEDAMGAMDMDELDEDAMTRFALGVGGQQMSIHDLEVEERVRREDVDRSSEVDELDSESGSEDLDEVLRDAERELLGESEEDSDEEVDELDESGAEDGQPVAGPSGGFQARLERAKAAQARAIKKGKWRLNYDEDDSSDEEAPFEGGFAWADKEGDLVDEIQVLLDENEDLLKGKDRKSRKKLFNAIRDGNLGGVVDMDDELFASSILKSKNRKRNDLPPELQILWDKDRAKKADYKRARAHERKRQLGNPFKTAKKDKGKKKGKSNPDESDTSESDSEFEPEFEEITDMFSLERMIRVFLRDLGRSAMTLPAMDKESRRRVHLLADCFKLKSQSKGSGTDRFPILTKTTRSGIKIDEDKVERILRASKESGPGSNMASFNKAYFKRKDTGGAKKGGGHVEGEIVGAKAAKIADTNVGYKMLQLMGWSEGDRIGLTAGGIIDPLTARIKRTKLGLGATS